MNFEVLVHGVPYGKDYWGPDSDRSYAEKFYDTSENGLQYVVETREVDGKNYCYYTIVRYGNVLSFEKPNDNGSRGGSYVAVTYRFDMFYTDAKRVFQILETVFEKCIVGSIIEYSGTNYKFLCRSLKEKKDVMKKAEDDTLKLFQLSVIDDKFLPIDDAFIHPSLVKTSNIADCTESNVITGLREVSKLVFTTNAPDARDEKIAELQGDLATEKAQHQKDNEVWRGKLEAIKTDDKLIAENQNLSNELFQSKKNYEGLESRFKKLSKKWNIALCILVPLLVLSLGAMAYLKFAAPSSPNDANTVPLSEYVTLQQKYDSLQLALANNDNSRLVAESQKENESFRNKNEDLDTVNACMNNQLTNKVSTDESEVQDITTDKQYPSADKLEIWFESGSLTGTKTKPFNKNKKYDVKIKGYDGKGIWEVSGLGWDSTEKPNEIKVYYSSEKGNETRNITFTLPNRTKICRGEERLNFK